MSDLQEGAGPQATATTDTTSGFEPWIQNVPKPLVKDEMKGHKSQWDYLQTVWKARDELAQKVEGYKGYVKPIGPDSSPEDVSAYKKAIGVPDSPDGYKIEGVDADTAKEVATIAAKLNLTQAQAQALAKEQQAMGEAWVKQKEEETLKTRDSTISALKKDWPNDWKEKVQSTNTTLRRFFGEEGMQKIAESGLGDAEWFVRGAIEMAKAYKEGRLPTEGASAEGQSLDDIYPSMKGLKTRRW